MVDVTTIIKENRAISDSFYLLTFNWDKSWGIPSAGMFLEVKVSESTTPLLRRPLGFSAYDSNSNTASLIYEVRGSATKILAEKTDGDKIGLIAPLGTHFSKNPNKILAIGGGVGLGPALFAAQQAFDNNSPFKLILGYRNSKLVPNLEFAKHLNPIICTDDGSVGFNGNVVEYLKSLNDNEIENSTIQSCGPIPMLKACHNYSLESSINCEVSMEEMMACGVGACSGCVIEMARGDLSKVCKDGPVFKSGDLAWI